MRWATVLAVAAVCVTAPPSHAQGGGGVIPQRARIDTTRGPSRDTTKKDSITMSPPDSVERALMLRRGYVQTRYQGDSVTYEAEKRGLVIFGKPTIVERDKTRIVGTWISYDDVVQLIRAFGKPARVSDPSRPDDILAYDSLKYYVDEHRGVAGDVQTKATAGVPWYLKSKRGGFVSDSSTDRFYCRDTEMTTDPVMQNPDSIPHYYFAVGECKKVGSYSLVARPAILHIGEVPVMWIPWLYNDLRRGRRTGLLTPSFGFSDFVRNSPTYRRTVENLGFYIAPSDYYDAQAALDWRSGARPSVGDPGWVRMHANVRYAWLDRFISGNIGLMRETDDDGSTNLNLSFGHQQKFSQTTTLTLNANYVTNTTVQRSSALNPAAAIANINSQANYSTQYGPLSVGLGGTMTQHPGRGQLDRTFPTLSVTSKPIQLAPWLTWTPSLNLSTQQSLHLDSPTEFGFHFVPNPSGGLDSVATDRNTRNSTIGFGTPFKIGNFTVNATANVRDLENDYPESRLVINPSDTSIRRNIVFARTYSTQFDWDIGINLPQLSQGRWNLTPSIAFRNVDPSAYAIRTELSGHNFVSQTKRPTYGLSISPTFFARTGPIGPFAAIRHSITWGVTYSYAPAASVSDAFLAAQGHVRPGYLGAIAQNRVSLTLTNVIEAKFRQSADSTPGTPARKIKLLSLNFTPLDYDFERARVTKRTGFASDRFGISARSDLLPGLDFGIDYSLFDAPSISDTAHFAPYPETVHATLTLGSGSGGASLGPLGRLIQFLTGEHAVPQKDTTSTPGTPGAAAQPFGVASGITQQPFSAVQSSAALMNVPTGQGWQATLSLSASHPRPPRGQNVIAVDPTAKCDVFRDSNPLQYDICLQQQTPVNTDLTQNQTTGGGIVYRLPPQTSVQATLRFNLTRNWAASWQSSYDVVRGEFASQILSLQRDIHDWRAIFGFSQASNGNFSFNFLISLKPVPEIKLPYNKPSYHSTGATGR